jgi:hypothetical protein
MSIRISGLVLAMLFLGACDKDPSPPKTPPTPAAPAVAETPAPAPVEAPKAKPAAKPAPVQTVKPLQPLIESKLEPLPEKPVTPVAEPEPVKKVVRTPQPPDKIQRLQVKAPQTAAQKKASDAVKQVKVEKPKLDLHLPKDLVKKLEPAVATTPGAAPTVSTTTEPALLPQMFAEKQGQSAFEMGGRVITTDKTRDQDKDSSGLLDSVDGAELQFKFRH